MDSISIEVLVSPDQENSKAFARLIPHLGGTAEPPGADTVARVLASAANTVFAARVNGRIAGLLVLVVLELPTGTEARIEDVVVDPTVRRLGVGRALVAAALDAARVRGAGHVELTSAPHRQAARALYGGLGFAERDTGVFRHTLR